MTTERSNPNPDDDDDALGVLDETGAISTAGIGLFGETTSAVPVALPGGDEDDDLIDDGEAADDAYALVLDADPAALMPADDGIGRIHRGFAASDIVIELPAGIAADARAAAADATTAAAEAAPAPDSLTVPPPVLAPLSATAPAPRPAESVHDEPVRDDPALHEPVLAEPVREDPTRGEPVLAEPLRDEPVRDEPVRDEPVRDEPVGGGPVPARPVAAAERGTRARTDRSPGNSSPPEPALVSRRLDQLDDGQRESAELLTADRLLDPHQLTGPEPEGAWSHLVYTVSGRRINLGDGRRARARKALSARIAAPLSGTARFVPVLSRKGGVGKTTVTALLGMALADAREDRVIAVDANPDRGTLADRISRATGRTVRDLLRIHDQVTDYHEISAVVSRDGTRLDVLASDTDPRVSEAFSDLDYEQVAAVAAHHYSLVLTDTGTGIVHSVMGATLDHADTLVIVAGLSVDEARLASETLTWLEANGYADKVRDAVVVLNQSTPGAPMVRLDELEAHFRTRVAHVLRIPYDRQIAAGSAIVYATLRPETRQAARELAAIVVEGLRAQAA